MILVGVHLALSVERSIEVRLVVLATVVGAVVEAIQMATGTYRFTSGTMSDALAPPWLLAMWAQLATTFRFSLRSVITRPVPAVLFGALRRPPRVSRGRAAGRGHPAAAARLRAVSPLHLLGDRLGGLLRGRAPRHGATARIQVSRPRAASGAWSSRHAWAAHTWRSRRRSSPAPPGSGQARGQAEVPWCRRRERTSRGPTAPCSWPGSWLSP